MAGIETTSSSSGSRADGLWSPSRRVSSIALMVSGRERAEEGVVERVDAREHLGFDLVGVDLFFAELFDEEHELDDVERADDN